MDGYVTFTVSDKKCVQHYFFKVNIELWLACFKNIHKLTIQSHNTTFNKCGTRVCMGECVGGVWVGCGWGVGGVWVGCGVWGCK